MWAITLLAEVNDTLEDAQALADRARAFCHATKLRPQIRIIQYNPVDAPDRAPFRQSDESRETAFCALLRREGFPAHKRYSGGADVHAACGQLAGMLRK